MKYNTSVLSMIDALTDSLCTTISTEQILAQSRSSSLLEQIQDSLRLRNLPDKQVHPVSQWILDALFGQALIKKLFSDPMITDMKIFSYNHIRLKCLQSRKDSPLCFSSSRQYLHFTEHLLRRNNLHFSTVNSFLSFCDPHFSPEDFLCYHISSRIVNSSMCPYVHIHRIPKQNRGIPDLTASGMLDAQAASYLTAQAVQGKCILFTGNSRQGQSLLINALLDHIPHSQSALAIQEQDNLFNAAHPEFLFQYTVPKTPSCSSKELIKNSLLTDTDYLILDELNRENALPFWQALTLGCCCWSGLPSRNVDQALDTLTDYLCQEARCPRETVLPSLSRISCVVTLTDTRVTELVEIGDWDPKEQKLEMKRLI